MSDATGEDGEALTPDEIQEVERELTRQISTAVSIAKGRGQLPSGFADAISADNAPSQDWSDIIQASLQDDAPSDFSFSKPNRFHMGGDIIMPSVERDGMGPIAIFADASGSVSSGEFAQFMSDISAICEELNPESVMLIQFDTDCAEPEYLERGDTPELVRRKDGGTTFSAPFKYAEKHDLLDDLEAIIVFTDGGDNQYADEPDCKVIWATTGAFWNGKPPYGEVVSVTFNKAA